MLMTAKDFIGKVIKEVIPEYAGYCRLRIEFEDGTALEIPHKGMDLIQVWAKRPVVKKEWGWGGLDAS